MSNSLNWALIEQIIETRFAVQPHDGPDKVLPLAEMVRRFIRPAMAMHVDAAADVVLREIVRQFYGQRPGFTIIKHNLSWEALSLVHCNMVRKAITALSGELYPTPGPSAMMQRAYRDKAVEIELWSLLGLTQRLIAGALGLPFLPTKSIVGSTMAEQNSEAFRSVADPFGGQAEVGVVKALNPDISIVHAWAADRSGNAILRPPFSSGEIGWGPRAAKEGTLVTAEYIVSTDFMREHQHLVNVPAHVVKAVCHTPLGAHPDHMGFNLGVGEFEPYDQDHDFMVSRRRATRRPDDVDAWIKEWILDCPTHADYLRKLGDERIASLRNLVPDRWRRNLAAWAGKVSFDDPPTRREGMIAAAARKIKASVVEHGHETMLSGIGASSLASWIAYFQLRDEGRNIALLVGSGMYGMTPRPGDPFLASIATVKTCKMLTNAVDSYGALVGGANNRCIAAVSAGQVDRFGNTNVTVMPGGVFLSGAGGGNDAANAREVIVVQAQSRERLVAKVDYVSSPGTNVRALVTDLGVFEKLGGSEFVLTGYLDDAGQTEDEIVAEIKATCGWKITTAPRLEKIAPPTRDELEMLRLFDPEKLFIK